MAALQESLRDLGVQHVQWRARPRDYLVVRDAIIAAIRKSSASWDATLEKDWKRAITAIAVPMLQGAAVHTAMVAEQLEDDQ
jgi:hemoglobin-like flavoprotein